MRSAAANVRRPRGSDVRQNSRHGHESLWLLCARRSQPSLADAAMAVNEEEAAVIAGMLRRAQTVGAKEAVTVASFSI